MAWARPSELHRALHCPASTVLPREPDKTDEESPAAEWGHEAHKWKETGWAPTKRFAKWLTEIKEDPYQLRKRYWPDDDGHEILLKLSVNGEAWAEKYSTEERRIQFLHDEKHELISRGIADYIGKGLVYHINDLKTGRQPPGLTGHYNPDTHQYTIEGEAESPDEIPQLLIYSDIWLTLFPAEPGIELSIDHWPRYPKGKPPTRIGPVYTTKKQITEWHHEQLIPAYELSHRPDAKYDQRPGSWCQWCRSAPWCAAVGGILEA